MRLLPGMQVNPCQASLMGTSGAACRLASSGCASMYGRGDGNRRDGPPPAAAWDYRDAQQALRNMGVSFELPNDEHGSSTQNHGNTIHFQEIIVFP